MKKLALAFGLCLTATAASAQSIEFRTGPDRGFDRDRTVRTEVRRDRGWDDDRVVVRRRRDVYETGNVGCRTIIVKKEDDFGRMVTKRIRKCGE
ncbi:MAG TPA: hypothetical protein VF601_03610 [Beijerinckiaceae bacterium]|jgi:hypothetical protein